MTTPPKPPILSPRVASPPVASPPVVAPQNRVGTVKTSPANKTTAAVSWQSGRQPAIDRAAFRPVAEGLLWMLVSLAASSVLSFACGVLAGIVGPAEPAVIIAETICGLLGIGTSVYGLLRCAQLPQEVKGKGLVKIALVSIALVFLSGLIPTICILIWGNHFAFLLGYIPMFVLSELALVAFLLFLWKLAEHLRHAGLVRRARSVMTLHVVATITVLLSLYFWYEIAFGMFTDASEADFTTTRFRVFLVLAATSSSLCLLVVMVWVLMYWLLLAGLRKQLLPGE